MVLCRHGRVGAVLHRQDVLVARHGRGGEDHAEQVGRENVQRTMCSESVENAEEFL